MIEISFEINGKKVDPDDISDGIERATLKLFESFLREDIGSVRCPEHGTAPKVLCSGEDLNHLVIENYGCCDELALACNEAIKANADSDYLQKNHIEIFGEEAHRLKSRFTCQTCKQSTLHILQYAQTTGLYGNTWPHDESPYWFTWDVWLIWRCKKCLTLTLEVTHKTPAWFQGNTLEDDDYEAHSTFYPVADDEKLAKSKTPNSKSFDHAPRKIRNAYAEVTKAFHNNLDVLCTIGLRSLIEEICDNKKLEGHGLPQKIDALATLNIPVSVIENLKGVKELGNNAAHQLTPSKRQDLVLAIDLIEGILDIIYEAGPRSKPLKKHWIETEKKRQKGKRLKSESATQK